MNSKRFGAWLSHRKFVRTGDTTQDSEETANYEGWIVPKGGCVLGGDGLVGGGGLTSKVATCVTWWRRLNLEGGDGCYLVAAA